jgi:sortase (surface protein transpeptidase)
MFQLNVLKPLVFHMLCDSMVYATVFLLTHFNLQQLLEHKLEIEKMKQRERVKQINQQQIAMREAGREEAMQEYQKEKSQVDELVSRIAISPSDTPAWLLLSLPRASRSAAG